MNLLRYIPGIFLLIVVDGKTLSPKEDRDCDLLLSRIKRDVNNFIDDDDAFLDSLIKSTLLREKQKCMEKYALQESRHQPDDDGTHELRKEVSKLKDLVSVIKDQQYILNALEPGHVPSAAEGKQLKDDATEELAVVRGELSKLKDALRNKLSTSDTHVQPAPPQHAQIQATLERQQADIDNMKHLLEGLLVEMKQVSGGQKPADEMRTMLNELRLLEKKLSNAPTKKSFSKKDKEVVGMVHNSQVHPPSEEASETDVNPSARSATARASDDMAALLELLAPDSPSDSMSALLKSLDTDSSDVELEQRLLSIEKQVKRKKKKQLQDRLKALEKQLNNDGVESKTDDSDISSDVKRLLMKLIRDKNNNQIQSKSLDDELILDELKALQKSINSMSSDDSDSFFGDLDLEEKNGNLDVNINKLISSGLVGGGNRKRKLTRAQIHAIRKRIMAMKGGSFGGGYGNDGEVPYGDGDHYGSEGGGYGSYGAGYGPGSDVHGYAGYGDNGGHYFNNKNQYPGHGAGYEPNHAGPIGYGPYKYGMSSYMGENMWNIPTNQFGTPIYSNSGGYPPYSGPMPSYAMPPIQQVYSQPATATIYDSKPQNQFFHGQDVEGTYTPQSNPGAPGHAQPYQNQHNTVSDLKNEIHELQGVINAYNRPEYIQKPEDKQTVYMLDRQIKDLQNVINNLQEPGYQNSAPVPSPSYSPPNPMEQTQAGVYAPPSQPGPPPQSSPPSGEGYAPVAPLPPPPASPSGPESQQSGDYKPRSRSFRKLFKRDVSHQTARHEDAFQQLATFLASVLEGSEDDEPAGHLDNSVGAATPSNHLLDDISRRIADVRKQLDIHRSSYQKPGPRDSNYNYGGYDNQGHEGYNGYAIKTFEKHTKKEDFLDKIFDKILDKIITKLEKAFPKIIEVLFGKLDYSYSDDYNNNGNYNYNGNNVEYGLEKNFHGMGLSGILPLIIVKFLSKIHYVFKYMQKYKFFKGFLVPAIILAVVAGSVIFLTWWLQPNEDDHEYQQLNYQDGSYGGYYRNSQSTRTTNLNIPQCRHQVSDKGINNSRAVTNYKPFQQ